MSQFPESPEKRFFVYNTKTLINPQAGGMAVARSYGFE